MGSDCPPPSSESRPPSLAAIGFLAVFAVSMDFDKSISSNLLNAVNSRSAVGMNPLIYRDVVKVKKCIMLGEILNF